MEFKVKSITPIYITIGHGLCAKLLQQKNNECKKVAKYYCRLFLSVIERK